MIRVDRPTEENQPALFEENCRMPGAAWLATYPDKDPHEQSEWWAQFRPDIAKLFSYRCGWQATYIGIEGVVEHWLSCGHRQKLPSPHRHVAFEWTNYRYATATINSLKGALDDQILDPCDVQDGWFEVHLPSFQLLATDKLPTELQEKAKFTLEKLQLRRGHHARWTRWDWYRRYWNQGNPDLDRLFQDAPLVAAAVKKALENKTPLPNPNDSPPEHEIKPRKRNWGARRRKTSPDAP